MTLAEDWPPAAYPCDPLRTSRRAALMSAVHGPGPGAVPPLTGWRSAAWHLGARRIGPGRRDRARVSWQQLTGRPLSEPKIIAVFSPLGGVGKTTTAVQAGHMLAMSRSDLVVALDANPGCGNLVKHISGPHSDQGAAGLHRDAASVARCTDLLPYVTRAGSGLWVIGSGRDPRSHLSAAGYRRVLQVVSTYSSVIVTDLGAGVREPGFLAIAESADALVGVAPPVEEGVEAVLDSIDRVNQRFPGKNRACALVVNHVRPRSGPPGLDVLAAGSELYVDQVLEVPHDPHLAARGVCRPAMLSRRTQDAYLQLTATVITLLADQERLGAEPPATSARCPVRPAASPERTIT